MPTNRTRRTRALRRGAVPPGAWWWLDHCRSPQMAEAEALGLSAADVWLAANLFFDRPTVRGWTRADLREEGFGGTIDRHIAEGRCPPDRAA